MIRRLLKLVCLSMLGIISVAWLYSHFDGLSWFTSSYSPWGGVVLNKGAVILHYQGWGFFSKPIALTPQQQREVRLIGQQVDALMRQGVEDPMRQLLADLMRQRVPGVRQKRTFPSGRCSFLGFRWEFSWLGSSPVDLTLRLPLWAPALAFVAILCAWPLGRAIRRRRRRLHGRCESCNYDLTGNTSGVCPECGATIKRLSCSEEPTPTSNVACRS